MHLRSGVGSGFWDVIGVHGSGGGAGVWDAIMQLGFVVQEMGGAGFWDVTRVQELGQGCGVQLIRGTAPPKPL